MHKSRNTVTLLALLFFNPIAQADEPTNEEWLTADQSAKVDEIFSKLDDLGRPGCAVSVVRDGTVLYSRGFGLAQLEYDIPIKPDTIFHVASVSKQFTAFAVALLANDGKLDLDDDVRDYVSEVPDFGHRITLRHLIHHTSGLRDQWDLFSLAGGRMDDVISKSDVLELVSKQSDLNFPPGDEHLYCNTGYTLLGVVVEHVSGISLKDFCAQRMFEPLGMTRTHFHEDHRHIVPSRAYSYSRDGKLGYQKSVLSYANAGATSLFTTVEDLAKWQRNFEQPKVGNAQVFSTMLTRGQLNDGTVLDYAGGLAHQKYRGLNLVGHSGGDAGFRAYVGRFPLHNLSVAVLGNDAACGPSQLAMKVVDVILKDDFPTPSQKTQASDLIAKSEATAEHETGTTALTQVELDCAGWYFDHLQASLYVVTSRADQLYMQTGYRKPILIRKVSPLRFESTTEKFPFAIVFQPNSQLAIGRAAITFPKGKPHRLEAVEEKGTEEEYLSQLPGRYFSDELDAFYDITCNDKHLSLNRRRNSDVPLRLRFRDAFNAGNMVIRLTRNDENKITGFQLSTGRVRNLRFIRVADAR